MEKEITRLDWRSFMKASDEMSQKDIAVLDRYFSQFAALEIKDNELQSQKCISCSEPLTGFQAILLGRGGFEWGLTHGQGHCAGCKWPAFGHHYIKDEEGNDIVTLRNFILQVHPDFVKRQKKMA